MTSRFLHTTLALLLTIVLITPTAFFIAPPRAAALFGSGEFSDLYNSAYDSVLNAGGTQEAAKAAGTAATGETAANINGGGCLAALSSVYSAGAAAMTSGATVLGTGTGIKTDPSGWQSTAAACISSTIQIIQQTITSAATVTSAAAGQALVFNVYVLQPLAFVLSGNLLKVMTQGIIAFVIGQANGTGIPQFVADIEVSLQTVSDNHAFKFFNEEIRNSKSPYAGSIVDALRRDYLNRTSLEGFWAQNMDTLRRTSPNPYGYLNGLWAAGGVGAWFALTTQTQNNPYFMYQDGQNKLAGLIGPGAGGVTGARMEDISNGQGFVSWCGPNDNLVGGVSFLGSETLGEFTTDAGAGARAAAVDRAGNDAYDFTYNAAIAAGENADAYASAAYDTAKSAALSSGKSEFQATEAAAAASRAAKAAALARAANATTEANAAKAAAKSAAFAKAKAANAGNSFLGVAPGDPCTNEDGTTGTIKTPGSVILAGLNKALGGQQDNVVRMGNVGPQINQILSNVAVVLRTVNFATQILGGPGSNGLFGVNQPSGANGISPLRQYVESPGNLGVTNASVTQNAATLSLSGSDMLSRVAQYESAVNVIAAAANTASTSVASLISYCTDQQQIASNTLSATGNSIDLANLSTFASTSATQITAAQNALTIAIAPVFSRIITASTTAAAARALVQKIQLALNAVEGIGAEYTVDLQKLQTMPPSTVDLADAQQGAIKPSVTMSTANPSGSLNVSGSSITDQMGLISTNATALRSVCIAPAPTPVAAPEPTP